MTPRAIGTIARTVVAIFAAAVFGALSFAVAAGAQSPAKPSPKVTKPPVLTITITGPDVSPPIVIRSTEDPTLYAQIQAQVSWMKSATGNVMPSTPTQLGPDYTVTMMTGTTKTGVYDLYPLVATGPRAHRAAIGSHKAAWFFAPISMASALEAAGVTFPTSPASGQAAPPTVATSAPSTSLSKIVAQSKIALGLAAVAAAAVLVMLALAARRSRRLDRRRAMPAALARLETVAGRARGTGLGSAALATSGAGLRPAVPAARAEVGAAKATGTARVKPPSQATSSAPDAGSAPRPTAPLSTAPPSTAPVSEASASVPPRDGPPLSQPGQSASRLDSGQSGSGVSGSATGTVPVGSTPAEPPGGQPTGPWFATRNAGQRSPDQPGGASAQVDPPDNDARPPTQRAAVDAPVDPPAEVPVEAPAEIAVGTAHVVTTAGTAEADANASVMGTAKVTTAEDRAVGVAPAPRAPADDVVEPQLGRPYVMTGAAADRASVTPATEAETPEAEPTGGGTDVEGRANAEALPAGTAPAEPAPAEQSPAGQLETEREEAREPSAVVAAPAEHGDAATGGADMTEPDLIASADGDSADNPDAEAAADDTANGDADADAHGEADTDLADNADAVSDADAADDAIADASTDTVAADKADADGEADGVTADVDSDADGEADTDADADSDADAVTGDAGATADADADADSDADAADNGNADADAEADNAAEHVTDIDGDDGLDAAADEVPVTAASDDDTDAAASTAETESGSGANGTTAADDSDTGTTAPAIAVPEESENDPDGTATDAGPAESEGERP